MRFQEVDLKMDVSKEYVFIVFRELRKIQFNPDSGERFDVPTLYPVQVDRGVFVRFVGDAGLMLEDGRFVSFKAFDEAIPVNLFEKMGVEGNAKQA